MSGRKTLVAAVGAALALALSAGTAAAQETLRVAADVGYAPHAMATPTGGVEGYNIDIAHAIAEKLGKKVEVVDQQYSAIFAGLNAKKFDMIVAPVTITEARASNMLLTEPYADSDYQFIIKKGAPQITSLDDLKGKTIAVNKGNLYDKWLSDRQDQYGWEIMRFDKNADSIAAVIAGRAVANMSGNTVPGYVAKLNPMIEPSTHQIVTGQGFGLAFRLDDAESRNKVELILECLKKDGVIAGIHEKWTGQKPRADGATMNVFPGFGPPGFPGYDPTPHEMQCK